MRVLVVIVVVIVTWESKANSSSSLTELQTGTELGNNRKSENDKTVRQKMWKT